MSEAIDCKNTDVGRFKAYPKRKDTGVDLLGAIPSHWQVRPLKYSASMNPDVLPEETDPDFSFEYLDIAGVNSLGKIGHTEIVHFETAPSRARRCLQFGDTIISTVRTYLKAIAFIEEANQDLIVSTGFSVLRPSDEVEPRFFWRAVQSDLFVQMVVAYSEGTGYPAINPSRLGLIPIVVPPREEQEAIVNFLDRETAKIDALVAKKERLIELLQEKRTAIIIHAVTKGLDPLAPMRESGVEWLGEVPARWEVAPLSARYEVTLGKMLDAKQVTGDHLAPYLRNIDVQWDRINVQDLPEMDFDPEERGRFKLRVGDLLVCEGGEVGRAAIWGGDIDECYYQKAIHRLRAQTGDNDPLFLLYVLKAAARLGVFVADSNPNTIDHLTAVKLRHHRFPFPSWAEQTEIARLLERSTANIDGLMAKIKQGIERLKEYRTALISAAVTGKIDLRDQVASDADS
jgi:type I restriction enzyme S subunit